VADLTPKAGKLLWLSLEEVAWLETLRSATVRDVEVLEATGQEVALLAALRADPDQDRHIADCEWNDRGGIAVTVRHPITERLLSDDALFTCPALAHAIGWLEDEDEPGGRWRLDTEGATWERIA
jgi:hypothetical protein